MGVGVGMAVVSWRWHRCQGTKMINLGLEISQEGMAMVVELEVMMVMAVVKVVAVVAAMVAAISENQYD